jgi:hypothetical protein
MAPAPSPAYDPPVEYVLRRPKRVALLSLHSHGDRSFIDDQRLALWSGDLRVDGLENDLVVAALDPDDGADPARARLRELLDAYDTVVFDRVWSHALIEELRRAHAECDFIWVESEHAVDTPPADWASTGDQLSKLVAYLRGEREAPPIDARRITPGVPLARLPFPPSPRDRARAFAPNLHPLNLTPGAAGTRRTFSIMGNGGCPYQADARENPVYSGTSIPRHSGRGCAFCTTGNKYEFRPAPETAAEVLEQLRYIRRNAPELDRLVLKDQNPFGYLTEVAAAVEEERLGPFTLLLETRADWFLRSQKRLEQALTHARNAGLVLAPYLVGIENFSDAELARFNKGTDGAANERFLAQLRAWKETFGPALSLEHCSFGFILFTPWTTLADLRVNYEAMRRTRFTEFRGSVLLSRARLYPDTALLHLAARDGLLADRWDDRAADNARRYGYHESQPWRFAHEEVARFAALAAELSERTGSRDQLGLFEALLAAFEGATDPAEITADSVFARLAAPSRPDPAPAPPPVVEAGPEVRERFARLVRPLAFERAFAEGFRFGALSVGEGRLRIELTRSDEEPLLVEILPRANATGFSHSRHYAIRHVNPAVTAPQRRALEALCQAIARNDR